MVILRILLKGPVFLKLTDVRVDLTLRGTECWIDIKELKFAIDHIDEKSLPHEIAECFIIQDCIYKQFKFSISWFLTVIEIRDQAANPSQSPCLQC